MTRLRKSIEQIGDWVDDRPQNPCLLGILLALRRIRFELGLKYSSTEVPECRDERGVKVNIDKEGLRFGRSLNKVSLWRTEVRKRMNARNDVRALTEWVGACREQSYWRYLYRAQEIKWQQNRRDPVVTEYAVTPSQQKRGSAKSDDQHTRFKESRHNHSIITDSDASFPLLSGASLTLKRWRVTTTNSHLV